MRDYEYSDLYFDAHLDKQIRIEVLGTGITIDNSMIELDAFELDEILCSEQELTFGSCEANCVKFTVRDMPGSIVGKTIRITETVDGNTDVPFSYGVYKVYSDVPTSDRTKREITAYDAMYDIVNTDVKSWYAGLSFPMTLRQFRDRFFTYFGIAQKETILANDGMTVNKTLVATQTDPDSTITEESAISGKTVIEAICEINGVFGNINRDGEFEYIELKEIIDPLYPADNLYPADDLFPRDPNTISMTGHYITFDYEDFQSKEITQIEIRTADDSAGAVVGTSGNDYVISGNFLVSDKSGAELSQIAANTLSIIRKSAYTPLISSEVVGNPCIELGDPIRFNTTREIVESYVLQRTLTGIQNKRDSIVSPGTEIHSQNPNSIRDQIESVQRRTNKLERTADHTLSELADLDANTSSRFEQTAEQIQTEVSNRQNADNEMSTRISQTVHSISLTATGGDNSVGITIHLYDENGNLIDTDSGNANINIVGFVTFSDLAGDGTTTINGKNIKTGTISCDLLSGGTINGQKFVQSGAYGDLIIDDGIIHIPAIGAIFIGGDEAATKLWVQDSAVAHASKSASSADYATSAGNSNYASNAGGLSGQPSVNLDNCKASDFFFIGSPSAGSSLLPIGYNSSTYHFGHYTGSSQRFKNRITDVEDPALDPHRLYGAKICQYKYNKDYLSNPFDCRYDRFVIGFIAEDLETVYPVAVDKDDNGVIMDWNYKYIIPPMLALIQEQHADIESLKQENLALKNRLSILEQKMEVLENVINNQNN